MGPPRGGFGDGGFGGGFGSSGGRTPNPYATSGGGGWGGGRTPNPYAAGGGKTPAWASSKTPNQEGGRTPFTTSSQTPNPYAQDGGRTPGWGPSARTPNPYTAPNKANTGSGWGGATPGWGGATPKPPSSTWNESSSPAPQSNNGWASPGPTSSAGAWGGETSNWVSLADCVTRSYTYIDRAHRPPLLGPRPPPLRLPLGAQDTDQQYTTPRHQPECLLIVLICLRKRQPHTRHTSGQGRQHSVSL
jgi:transcription elongation factor SPT5